MNTIIRFCVVAGLLAVVSGCETRVGNGMATPAPSTTATPVAPLPKTPVKQAANIKVDGDPGLPTGTANGGGGIEIARLPLEKVEPRPMDTEDEPKEEPGLPAPPLPKGLQALNKNGTLYLENGPTGRRVWILAEVVNRDIPLEVFLCRKMTKEHEAILAADLDARDIHMALLAMKATPGQTVQFVPNYVPASGDLMDVSVQYLEDGKTVTHSAQQWILDNSTKKPMTQPWVFAGSRFLKDPDNVNAPPFYTANNGEIISLSNFVDSMLDLPIASSQQGAELQFRTNTAKIPRLKSKVYVILERANKAL